MQSTTRGTGRKPPRSRPATSPGSKRTSVRPALILLAVALTTFTAAYVWHVQRHVTSLGGSADAADALSALLRRSHAARAPEHRLLLSTHNRLMWYTPATGGVKLLHEGQVGQRGRAGARPSSRRRRRTMRAMRAIPHLDDGDAHAVISPHPAAGRALRADAGRTRPQQRLVCPETPQLAPQHHRGVAGGGGH
jgi:hypothetical protein